MKSLRRKQTTKHIEVINPQYKGYMTNSYDTGISLGLQTTIHKSGVIFLTEDSREENDVWCVMGRGALEDNWAMCSVDYFWGILKVFPYDEKDKAEQYLKDLRGE